MKVICAWCHKELEDDGRYEGEAAPEISHGICPACYAQFLSNTRPTLEDFLNRLPVPVLSVNDLGEVEFANKQALTILGKGLPEVANQKGGDAMECAYARLPGGCGNTIHCKTCTIRNSVMETHETGQSLFHVPAYLNRRSEGGITRIRFLISTRKVGDVVLLRIDEVTQPQ